MSKRLWRHGFVAVAMIAMFAMAQPVAAFTKTGQTGAIGSYVVHDSYGDEGSVCVYDDGPGEFQHLWRMWVSDPDMTARIGMAREKVGFRYTIQRKIQGQGWTNRVTSKIFSAYTDSAHYAGIFSNPVRVIVPYDPSGPSASYRALITMFWYGADGRSVIGTVSGRMKYYALYHSDGSWSTVSASCPGYI